MTELYLKILVGLVSPLILAVIIISMGKQQSKQIGWLILAMILGAIVSPIAHLLNYIGVPSIQYDTLSGAALSAFLDAAIPEEAVKFLVLLLIAYKCKYFDTFYAGIMYSVYISMGFAGLENILYLINYEGLWIVNGISRNIMAVPMHYFCAVIMGAYFSRGWFDEKNRPLYLSAALIVPIILHGLYDFLNLALLIDDNLIGYIIVLFIAGFIHLFRYTKSLISSMRKMDVCSLS